MPRRVFWQPYSYSQPDPTRWEFQFYPVTEEGHTGEPFPVLYDWISDDWVSCSGTYIADECQNRLVEFDGSRFIYPTADEIDACVDDNIVRCRFVEIQTPPDGWLAIRACGSPAISCSQWSVITVPEPGLTAALALGVLCLAAVRSWGSHRSGTVSGLWESGQRESLRGWARKMLGRHVRLVGGS